MHLSKNFLSILLFIIHLTAFAQSPPDTVMVFYLGGQSNMDGYGYNKDLPDSLKGIFDTAWIFHGNPAPDGDLSGGKGKWEKLQAGHGVGFSSDGRINKLSGRFGVELSLAHRLQALYPSKKIAFIKYSRGGTSIDSLAAKDFGAWEPDFRGKNGINQYDHFLQTIRMATSFSDIDGDGKDEVLKPCGIFWMQGESDAVIDEALAQRYYAHLKRLMDLIRAALHHDDLPVVIGKISDSGKDKADGKVWDYGELVQYAQEKFCQMDERAAIVRSTRNYQYSDPWHYNSAGYIDLGEQFAKAVFGLLEGK